MFNGVSGCSGYGYDRYDRGHVRGQGAEPGLAARDLAAGKLPAGAGKVKNRTLANLSVLARGQGRRAVPGAERPAAAPRALDGAFEITRSLPHGHVAAVLGTARALGLPELIEPGAVPAPGPGSRDGGRAGDRAGLQAGHRPRPARPDRCQLPGRGPAPRIVSTRMICMRRWTTCTGRQDAIQDALAARRLAGGTLVPLRRVVRGVRGADLPAGRRSATPRTASGPAARSSTGLLTQQGRHPGRDRGVQGQHRRLPRPSRARWTRSRTGSGSAGSVLVGDRGMLTAARLREDVGPAHLDWITALRAPQVRGAGPRRGPAADLVRRHRPGRDHLPELPRRAAGGLQEPVPRSRTRAQTRKPARPPTEADLAKIAAACARSPAAAARKGQDRRPRRQSPQPP